MIADSSSLIIFAKINKIDLLIELYGEILITKGIYKEIIEQGTSINASDAKILKNFVEDNKIKIINLDQKHTKLSEELRRIYSQIGMGESEAIALSLQEKNKSLIIDETFGRRIAKLYNLKSKGSLRVLVEAYKNNHINETEIKDIINEMIKNNFYLSAEVINEFWNIFEKLKKEKQ